ncbi:MAG: hypothetical protein ACLU84_04340 [Clostridia bacterium]
MRKLYKKVITINLVIILILSISTSIFAKDTKKHTAGEIIDEAGGFIENGVAAGGDKVITGEDLKNMSDTIYNILLIAGIAAAVIIGVLLGIKFVTGGIEGQVEVQKALIPYVAGCVIVFGAFIIWKIVVTMLMGLK